jgi:hypothetical protein
LTLSGAGEGVHVAVGNGIVAVSVGGQALEQIHRFDLSGNALSSFDAAGVYQDVVYEATTGTFYGVVLPAPFQPRLVNWNSSGTLLSDIPLTGLALSVPGDGIDLAVGNGIAAVTLGDQAHEQVQRFDLNGNALSPFDAAGVYQDVVFESTAGTFYGIVLPAPFQPRLVNWNSVGTLLSDTPLAGLTLSEPGEGTHLAVASIPEPGAIVLFGTAILVLLPLVSSRRR